MLDDRVRAVLERLEAEDAAEREAGVAREQRARQVARGTGQFLFSIVAPHWDCEVLEIGGSRGYSSIWLGAGVRYFGGRVLSLESDPAKVEAWRRNVAEAGLEETVELLEEIGIPLTPIRLKCALLGLGVLKVALHRAKGTPLPEEWAGLDDEFQVR